MEKIRTLLIDDEKPWLEEFKLGLELTGEFAVEIEPSVDKEKALVAARRFQPDLIIVDVLLREKDGGDIAASLLQHPNFKNTPVMYITGKAMTEAECERSGGMSGNQRIMIKSEGMERKLAKIANVLFRVK